ncbi:MAG: hypothetical protein HWD85_09465 [Flavobacteriaceae bacterium]|nr:hypothetical protein [Flavobacteriaceae bacterium]
MKKLVLFLMIVQFIACNKKQYTIVVVDNEKVQADFIHKIDRAEKALITWYLYAYGNECTNSKPATKCELLKLLEINNECNTKHLQMLKQWLSKDILASYKLKKCPNLPHNSAIQNSIDKLILTRNNKALSISYKIKGLNNSQEKSWNIERTDHYIIENNTFLKK